MIGRRGGRWSDGVVSVCQALIGAPLQPLPSLMRIEIDQLAATAHARRRSSDDTRRPLRARAVRRERRTNAADRRRRGVRRPIARATRSGARRRRRGRAFSLDTAPSSHPSGAPSESALAAARRVGAVASPDTPDGTASSTALSRGPSLASVGLRPDSAAGGRPPTAGSSRGPGTAAGLSRPGTIWLG